MTADAANAGSAYISLHENTYVRQIWMVMSDAFDVMGWMYRREGQPWTIGYRFRYYEDTKAFDSADRKVSYSITPRTFDPPESELVEVVAALDLALGSIAALEQRLGRRAEMHRLVCNCKGPEAFQLLSKQKWAHTMMFGGKA